METPAALLNAIQRLCESIDLEPRLLTKPLVQLGHELQDAVDAYIGVEVTVFTELGLPVTLTDFGLDTDLRAIRTSLRIPLTALTNAGSPGHVTFYGGRSGAFVDLAADLGFVLGSAGNDAARSKVNIRLDEHLQPANTRASLVGTSDASAVNRAIGVLIGRGRTPQEAEAELVLGADGAQISLAVHAAKTVRSAQPRAAEVETPRLVSRDDRA